MADVTEAATPYETPAKTATSDATLAVEDLKTYFYTRDGVVKAVDGVSFHVDAGETLAIVGESGCGKSMTALSIMRLIDGGNGRIVGGDIRLEGRDILALDERDMRRIRGNDIAMIFQEPMTSLNPVLTIGWQMRETIMLHQKVDRERAHKRALEMLNLVRIPEAERRLSEYPHQLSGGMRQRVMIAMSMSCNPKVLLADEPTTALDVTIQAQILTLMRRLKDDFRTSIVMITHDLGVVAETADRVVVMYAGRKVEEAPVDDLFARPRHAYTFGLLASIPRLDQAGIVDDAHRERLMEIPGIVPSLKDRPDGCLFAPRCAFATDKCRQTYPPLVEYEPGHWAACWESEKVMERAQS